MKAFVDHKIKVPNCLMNFIFDRVENIVKQGEMLVSLASYHSLKSVCFNDLYEFLRWIFLHPVSCYTPL